MADLGSSCRRSAIEALDVSDQADALIRAINDVVVDNVDGVRHRGATGLSIYFPPYLRSCSTRTTRAWRARPSGASSSPASTRSGEAIPEEEQPEFDDEADGGRRGLLRRGRPQHLRHVRHRRAGQPRRGDHQLRPRRRGRLHHLHRRGAGDDRATTARASALGIYDLTTLTITDGEDTAYAYLSLDVDEEAGIAHRSTSRSRTTRPE